ncbi:hypothetical protein HNQ56_003502 [Anaerotaenia torta]|uniref:hypothetical protein n=1 Tax=Anaerotaenia torta TaxID=433293 RepID=UPI003D1C8201
MKTAKKLIFSLLLAAMTFALLPATAHAEGGVTEQYSSLTPGHTYYFDLSGESLPGTANDWLPDTSLRWAPFTYVGTINAYSLDPSANGDFSASTAASASPSDRSLFVAEYPVTTQVSWNTLNSQNLIFGRDYQNGGVSYILRSLSAGSQLTGRDIPVTQANNEWDQILAKDRSYIKNFLGTNGASWGQDTVFYNTPSPLYRSLRGYYAADWWWFLSPGAVSSGDPASYSSYNCSFRPALEITSHPSAVLKTITLIMLRNGVKSLSAWFALSIPLLIAMNRTSASGNIISV